MTREQLLARMRAISEDTSALARHERLTRAQERKFSELSEEFERLEGELRTMDTRNREAEILRSLASGSGEYRVEGESPGPTNAQPRAHRSELRGRALDLIT